MKRLIASLVIILMLGALSFLGNTITKKQYDKINDYLSYAEFFFENQDYNVAREKIKKGEEEWVKAEKFLAVFINHQLLEEVGLKLSTIEPFCKEETKEECFAAIKEAKIALIHMKNGQIPSFETIF